MCFRGAVSKLLGNIWSPMNLEQIFPRKNEVKRANTQTPALTRTHAGTHTHTHTHTHGWIWKRGSPNICQVSFQLLSVMAVQQRYKPSENGKANTAHRGSAGPDFKRALGFLLQIMLCKPHNIIGNGQINCVIDKAAFKICGHKILGKLFY